MQDQFDAISEPRRREILHLVKGRELAAGAIAAAFEDVSRPAISQHLRVLRECGLIKERRVGTSRLYRVDPSGFKDLRQFFSAFWDERLELLKEEVELDERNTDARFN